MNRTLGEALLWITHVLGELEVPYQIVGGVAANSYGSERPIADIDLYVPDDKALDRLADAAENLVVRPPTRHLDDHWDLRFLKIEWGGWEIEAAAASTALVWDRRRESWVPVGIQFENGEMRLVGGVGVRVMPKAQLLDYKRASGRAVDLEDIAAIEGRGDTSGSDST